MNNNNSQDLAIEMSGVVTTLQGELKFVRIGVCTNPEKKYHNHYCGIMFDLLGLNKNDKIYLITNVRIRDEFKGKGYDTEMINQFIIEHNESTILIVEDNDSKFWWNNRKGISVGNVSVVHSNDN